MYDTNATSELTRSRSDKVLFPRRSEPIDIDDDEFEDASPSRAASLPKSPELFQKRSALPEFATETKFEWKDLNVFVGSEDDEFQILHNSSGCIESGQLLAVMGGTHDCHRNLTLTFRVTLSQARARENRRCSTR